MATTIEDNGTVSFLYIEEIYSRPVGPSVIFPNGHIIYTNYHGSYHRTNGPAVINADGSKEYYINDTLVPTEMFFLKCGVL